jgi:hypothetical protein
VPNNITRLNSAYGPDGTYIPTSNMDAKVNGRPVVARWDPHPHASIHIGDIGDIVGQLEARLDAATAPAIIVNWAGDDQATIQQWSQYAVEVSSRPANVEAKGTPGATRNNLADVTKRPAITWPCAPRFEPASRDIHNAKYVD